MNTLITGADGSLGSALVKRLSDDGKVLAMPRRIHSKLHIEDFLWNNESAVVELGAAVLNDGINRLSWIGETPSNDAEIIERNVLAPYWTLNELVHLRGKQNPLRVIFVTSQTYRVPQRTTSLYCASKAAATMLMRVAARELAPHGWVINAVAPGKIVDTRMSELTDQQVCELRGWEQSEADRYAKALIPAGRFTTTAEVAEAIRDTLHAVSYMNGSVVELFGGV